MSHYSEATLIAAGDQARAYLRDLARAKRDHDPHCQIPNCPGTKVAAAVIAMDRPFLESLVCAAAVELSEKEETL